MKFKLIIIFFLITSCTQNYNQKSTKTPYNSKGFAYIYNEKDFIENVIKKKLDNNSFEIAHNKLRPGSLIRIINLKSKKSIILKNTKRFNYPEFYKIVITEAVAKELDLSFSSPLVEIIEVKKNKSFVAAKTKIFQEEKKIHSNAPVQTVKIDNISQNQLDDKRKKRKDIFYIVIADFYSKDSAKLLKKRITTELTDFNANKLIVLSKKANKISLISGPYSSVNLMKNDYIHLKNFGIEELDIGINE